ncbi:MAG TPA: hypothetical protein PK999_13585, partial [Nitrospira sp.]|nr:hypothetical protein [Nitrospira sp.]
RRKRNRNQPPAKRSRRPELGADDCYKSVGSSPVNNVEAQALPGEAVPGERHRALGQHQCHSTSKTEAAGMGW